MLFYNNPKWIQKYQSSQHNIKAINDRLLQHQHKKKNIDISIVIPAYNEAPNILKTIASIADSHTNYAFEIIVVNNNSTDNTQSIIDQLHVKSYLQPIQGCGPARQLGMENAEGKIILLADADCIYPAEWVEIMGGIIESKKYVCAYGKFSFILSKKNLAWYFLLHKILRNIIVEIRNVKRPFLNAYGLSMAFPKDLGMKIGFDMRNIRGEDGRMCYDLMKFGKVCYVKNKKAVAWTGDRVLLRDGSLIRALVNRIKEQFIHLPEYATLMPNHDTKKSSN